MSLVVSLRVPDGIVVAADSLSTAQNLVQIKLEPINKNPDAIPGSTLNVPPISIPFSASSFTQKLIPLSDGVAISSYGQGIINNKSTYYHLRQFEKTLEAELQVSTIVDQLVSFFENELSKQFPKYPEEASDDWKPIAFHVNGYEGDDGDDLTAVTYEVFVGKKSEIRRWDAIGCTIGGEMAIVRNMWSLGEGDPQYQFQYGLMSLQDAVDLCEFFIDTTAIFQRFTNRIPTVGGDVDVALITPFHGFQWLRRKSLMEVLDHGCKERE